MPLNRWSRRAWNAVGWLRSYWTDARYLVDRYMDYDPAARSRLEVLLLYPGVRAVAMHRVAHEIFKRGWHTSSRAVAELSRLLNNIEIHPGATIGRGVILDHGMGTGIGETAVIGDDCTLFPQSMLAAGKFERGKRHPTLEANVTVYSGAKVIGPVLVGSGAVIGANAVVLNSVPPGAVVMPTPARTIRRGPSDATPTSPRRRRGAQEAPRA